MTEAEPNLVAAGYDAVYAAMPDSPTLQRIWREQASGVDFPEGFDHISFVTSSQLSRMARELRLSNGPPSRFFLMSRGNRLIIGSLLRKTFHEIDSVTWENIRTWTAPAEIWTGAMSPDAQWCVTLGLGGASQIDDLTTRRTNPGKFDMKGASDATFSADGKWLAAGSFEGFVRIWDAVTLEPVTEFHGFLQGVYSVTFSPENDRLVTGSDGKEAIKLWDVESHEELLTLEGQGSMFNVTAFSPDGAVLGSMNSTDSKRSILHLWRAPSWAEIEAAEKTGALSTKENRLR